VLVCVHMFCVCVSVLVCVYTCFSVCVCERALAILFACVRGYRT